MKDSIVSVLKVIAIIIGLGLIIIGCLKLLVQTVLAIVIIIIGLVIFGAVFAIHKAKTGRTQ